MQTVLAAVPQRCKDELGVALDRVQNAGKAVAEDLAKEGIHKTTQHLIQVAAGVENVHNNLNNAKVRNEGDAPDERAEQMGN